MKNVMKAAAAAAALLATAGQVAAADWDGFYVGLNAGFADSSADSLTQMTGSGYFAAANLTSINANGATTLDTDGFTGGAQIGYNAQIAPSIVLGLEGDVNYYDGSDAKSLTVVYPVSAPFAYTLNAEVEQQYIATIRARLGVTIGTTGLIYATGGYAYTDAEYTVSFRDNFPGGVPVAVPHASGSASGWTLGAGGEWMIAPTTSFKVEYLHTDLGTVSASGAIGGAGGATRIFNGTLDLTEQTTRIGVNFHF